MSSRTEFIAAPVPAAPHKHRIRVELSDRRLPIRMQLRRLALLLRSIVSRGRMIAG